MQQCQLEIMAAAPVSAAWAEPDVPAAPVSAAWAEPDVPTAPATAAPIEPDLPPARPCDGGQAPPSGASGSDPTGSDEAVLWWAYRRTGEVSLRNRLVMLHGPWAEARTRRFARARGFDWREVWGAAALGLIEAVERFDPAAGVPFRAYATHRIQGALVDASRECYDHDFVVSSFGGGRGGEGPSASEDAPPSVPPPPADHVSHSPPDVAMHRSVVSRVLGCMPDDRSREIARRRFCLLQSVDEIAYYMVIEKSRVEEIMRDVVLPRARRLCVRIGCKPKRSGCL
ncbi:MAG: sigma factor [Planctomycetota bacterium]|jgi:hypothetical protein